MEARRPKETDAIKRRLESYVALQRTIDNQVERLIAISESMGSISTPKLTGLPGGGGDGTSKIEREVIRKVALEQKIEALRQREKEEGEALEALIDRLPSPDQQTVLQMKYIDRRHWWSICAALYSSEPDYDDNPEKYLKRAFKVHGRALLALARLPGAAS